jgi:hypothetical protein
MSTTERTPYDPIGLKGRFKRAFLTLGVPILLAAILPVAYAIVGAWVLFFVVIALADWHTVVKRNRMRRPSYKRGRPAGLFGGPTEKTTITETLLVVAVVLVGLPLIVGHEFSRAALRQSRTA